MREEWILSQHLSSILRKKISRAGDRTSDLLFSSPQCYRLSYRAWRYKNTYTYFRFNAQVDLTTAAKSFSVSWASRWKMTKYLFPGSRIWVISALDPVGGKQVMLYNRVQNMSSALWKGDLTLYHTIPTFNDPKEGRKHLKTFRKKEKMLLTSIFFFSQNAFCPFHNKFQFLGRSYFCHMCKSFQFGPLVSLPNLRRLT